jgi:predicted MFS family arabinose efflux permease
VQHPIAASIVSNAFDGSRSRTALGVYNFTGDVGKMAFPALTALLLTLMMWRSALWIVAGIGIAVALILLFLAPTPTAGRPRRSEFSSDTQVTSRGQAPLASFGFRLLFAISLIDSAARMGFLTFLPFLLQAKGAAIAQIGLGLTLVFAGGAAGKLVCGYLGARLGVLATSRALCSDGRGADKWSHFPDLTSRLEQIWLIVGLQPRAGYQHGRI